LKIAEIVASQGAPPVSMTPAINLPQVPLVSFHTGSKFATGANDNRAPVENNGTI